MRFRTLSVIEHYFYIIFCTHAKETCTHVIGVLISSGVISAFLVMYQGDRDQNSARLGALKKKEEEKNATYLLDVNWRRTSTTYGTSGRSDRCRSWLGYIIRRSRTHFRRIPRTVHCHPFARDTVAWTSTCIRISDAASRHDWTGRRAILEKPKATSPRQPSLRLSTIVAAGGCHPTAPAEAGPRTPD